jgi:hypothetical protein
VVFLLQKIYLSFSFLPISFQSCVQSCL